MSETLVCRTCGRIYDLPEQLNHGDCPACGTINCRPRAESETCDILSRATRQRLRCDFVHAESSYEYVLRNSPEEHEALWGLVQCRYGVEYVEDPRTRRLMPVVHAVRRRPMLTEPDFREACELAPEAIRAQYVQEAEYIDAVMAKIIEAAGNGESYDIFLCHKTSRTDGAEGYTEDFRRGTELYIRLKEMGYRVFFAPFAGLTPGENYEAGIFHALSTAKVMLVICSSAEYINSPWVRTEWQRFLEMSYEPGADKRLIPLLYDGFPPRRLPDDFRMLQAIAMGELNAAEKLMAAVEKYAGQRTPSKQEPAEIREPEGRRHPAPEHETPRPVPVQKPAAAIPERDYRLAVAAGGVVTIPPVIGAQPAPPKLSVPAPAPAEKPADANRSYTDESFFTTRDGDDGVRITGYTGSEAWVEIPPVIGGRRVVEISREAFANCRLPVNVVIPRGVLRIGEKAFFQCENLKSVTIPESVTDIGQKAFAGCRSMTDAVIPRDVTRIEEKLFEGCVSLRSISMPDGVTDIRWGAFRDCCSLTRVVFPASLRYIGKWAFDRCGRLSRVELPAALKRVEKEAFVGCPLSLPVRMKIRKLAPKVKW